MIRLTMLEGVSKVLFLGAHSDDIEIGCGGTILKLLQANGELDVRFVVFSADGRRAGEAIRSADSLLARAKGKEVIVRRHRESYFPYAGAEIKDYFAELGEMYSPDVIFTHQRHDLHQDHRLISELTWNTFRNHLILEYEIPKYDGDLTTPNAFLHLDRTIVEQKVHHLLESFESQLDKPWFSEETFMAVLRLRGIESRSPSGYAEGFHCRKLVVM